MRKLIGWKRGYIGSTFSHKPTNKKIKEKEKKKKKSEVEKE